MKYRWIGAILVIVGCGGFGFGIAASQRREMQQLRQLRKMIAYMECQLQFSLAPLPELCRMAAGEGGGKLKRLFLTLARELEEQRYPDVNSCMLCAIRKNAPLPDSVTKILKQLGHTLGTFDLPGQLKAFASAERECEREGNVLETNKEQRLRSYQTLGLCAGAALAILLL